MTWIRGHHCGADLHTRRPLPCEGDGRERIVGENLREPARGEAVLFGLHDSVDEPRKRLLSPGSLDDSDSH